MKKKSVKSNNPCQSPEYLGTGVIQTDIVKAHDGELSLKSPTNDEDSRGTKFIIELSITPS
jgi:hypothetical protein